MRYQSEGLLIEKGAFHQGHFDELVRELVGIKRLRSERDMKAAVIDMLSRYCGISPELSSDADIERTYDHYAQCIASATRSLSGYLDSLLVQDILERAQPHEFVRALSDPADLVDLMLSKHHEPRTRFEAQRALHLGALFFEYDYHFGTQEQLSFLLLQVDTFFNALFSLGRRRNRRIYHKIAEEDGSMCAVDIRIPLVDHTDETRRKNENQVFVAMRDVSVTHMGSDPVAYGLYTSRVKDRFSASLKSIRKGIPIRSLRDILANTLYLAPVHEEALDAVVYALGENLPIDLSDHTTHPYRVRDIKNLVPEEENGFTSPHFQMEKMVCQWRPSALHAQRQGVDAVLAFSERQREHFWSGVQHQTRGSILLEAQVGLIENFLNQRLLGGDENHRIYKLKQAVRRSTDMTDDAVPMLLKLLPEELFGIQFNDELIVNALFKKHMSEIGLYEGIKNE